MSKQTSLISQHEAAGGRIVDFAGWMLPVQYQGIREEHQAVRTQVGLFDVSHMGEIRVKGPHALSFLERVTTNLVSRLQKDQAQYNLLPNKEGGLVDDIYVYCLEPGSDYLLCVNASNDQKDWEWLNSNNHEGAELIWESSKWSQLAIQGPRAPEVVASVLDVPVDLKKNRIQRGTWKGFPFIYASSGYTGELGGEVFIENEGAAPLWTALLGGSGDIQVTPCGLGARDTLRTEMGYPLYGHEINDSLNPYCAGLGWVIKAEDKDFIAKNLLTEGLANGLSYKLVGLEMTDKAIPRAEYKLSDAQGQDLGWVTSGTFSPSLGKGIALAYVAAPFASIGNEILVDVRGRKQKAKLVPTPFYKK